ESQKLTQVTSGRYDEMAAEWSPDGTKIAFVSNHDQDPDRSGNTDIFVVDARAGATPRRLTDYPGPDRGKLAWSPDSKLSAYLRGSEDKFEAYNMNRLAVVPADGGSPRILTARLDRGVASPEFAPDGQSIVVLVADDRSEYPARVTVDGGEVERLLQQPLVASGLSSAAGHTALTVATDDASAEVF